MYRSAFSRRYLISFQDLYRILLEADSEGMLLEVDMLGVEKLILNPGTELRTGDGNEMKSICQSKVIDDLELD